MELEIVIPTYNRPKCIESYLIHLNKYYGKYDFGVYIIDSGTDCETEKVVKKYSYVRYEKINSNIDVDEKTIYALKKTIGNFVFLCGDGYALNVDMVFETISFDNSIDIYALYDKRWSKSRTNYVKKINKFFYEEKKDFFIDHFGMLTLYGGSIVNRKVIDKINFEYVVKKYGGYCFIYPCTIAEYSIGNFEVHLNNYLEEINEKKYPGWILNKQAVKVWAKYFCYSVDLLSNIFSKEDINKIIKNNFKENDFFTIKGLIWLRTTNNYSLKIYKTYKNEINRVISCNKFIAIFIAIFPKKIFLIFRRIYQKIKGVEIK